jgi:hypothetical protein
LKGGITLKVTNPSSEAVGNNVGGYLGQLWYGGPILGAKREKDRNGIEYWDIEVTGEVNNEDYDYSSDDEHGMGWHMYVSKEVDDNGFPFVELNTLDDYTSRGLQGPYGYGRRQLDGQQRVGFTKAEKKRINFMSDDELLAREKEKAERQQKEREESRIQAELMETPAQRTARLTELERIKEESRRKKREIQEEKRRKKEENRKKDLKLQLQAQQRRDAAGLARTPLQRSPSRDSANQSNSQGFIRNEVFPINALHQQQFNGNREQPQDTQGLSKRARKRANRHRREAEARLSQQRNLQAVNHSGIHFTSVHHSLPPRPHMVVSSRPVYVKQEPRDGALAWQGTSLFTNDSQGVKRQRCEDNDEEVASKRVKREI